MQASTYLHLWSKLDRKHVVSLVMQGSSEQVSFTWTGFAERLFRAHSTLSPFRPRSLWFPLSSTVVKQGKRTAPCLMFHLIASSSRKLSRSCRVSSVECHQYWRRVCAGAWALKKVHLSFPAGHGEEEKGKGQRRRKDIKSDSVPWGPSPQLEKNNGRWSAV